MERYKKWMLTLVTLLGLFFLVSTAGCDKYVRQKVLTFFFTGVPSVDGTVASESIQRIRSVEKKKEIRERVQVFVHGPYAAKMCHLCHEIEKKTREEKYKFGFPRLSDIPHKLLMPKNELCISCHDTKSYKSAYTEELWIHGPVSSGMCTACHHPHATRADYMLLRIKSVDLCSQCHTAGFILDTTEHTAKEECLECHNPHVGKDRYLLKKDYVETY